MYIMQFIKKNSILCNTYQMFLEPFEIKKKRSLKHYTKSPSILKVTGTIHAYLR